MKDYKNICVQFALKREFKGFTEPFFNQLFELKQKPFLCYQLKLKDSNVIFAISGLGKARAAACCQHLIDFYKPCIVINIGSAGGVCPRIKPKDIFFIATSIEYDFKSIKEKTPIIKTDNLLIELAIKLNLPLAVLGSADQNVDSAEKKEILHKLGVTVADWEGAAVMKTCHINGRKAAVFKIVTDTSNTDFAKEFSQNVYDFHRNLGKVVLNFLEAFLTLS